MDPKSLRYAPTHEWAAREGDTVTVGITKFAVEQLTDVTHVVYAAVFEKADVVEGLADARPDGGKPSDARQPLRAAGCMVRRPHSRAKAPYDSSGAPRR